MKKFFGVVLGTFTGLAIFFLVGMLIMVAVLSPEETKKKMNDNSIVHIKLTGNLNGEGQGILDNLSGDEKITDMSDIRKFFNTASDNEKVDGVYLEFNGFAPGMATAQELRKLISNYRNQGGKVYTHADYFDQLSYYVASACDSVFVSPGGGMDWKGLKAEITFFTSAMEKLGVEMQIIRHGQFKSAVEPFMLTEMSESNRLQTETLIGDLWNEITQAVSESRSVSIEKLNDLADNLSLLSAQDALDNGLVDGLKYHPNYMEFLKEEHEFFAFKDYDLPVKSSYKKDKIAVLNMIGDIVDGKGEDDEIGSSRFVKEIEKLANDDKIKAVVLHVNSPGGSALASDNMWNSLKRLKEKKPLVVYMSDYAASGGYYISACADSIFAQATTITGSIGVFGMIPNAQALMEDKLGIKIDVAKTNDHADVGSLFNPLDEYERGVIQQSVVNVYEQFIGVVAEGRGLTKEEVDAIGQGRVWSGSRAIEIGLVDKLGCLQDAIDCAARLGGVEEFVVKTYPKKKTMEQKIMQALGGEDLKEAHLSADVLRFVNYMEYLQKNRGVMARPAYFLEIK